jgi:hypothetical protein
VQRTAHRAITGKKAGPAWKALIFRGFLFLAAVSMAVSLRAAVPSAINTLVASTGTVNNTDGQIRLQWTAPVNGTSALPASYDIRYSTTPPGASTTTWWAAAAQMTWEPAVQANPTVQSSTVTALVPGATYYFAIKTTNASGTSPLSSTTTAISVAAPAFDATQMNVDGLNGGLNFGDAVWGDYDGDGLPDIAASGGDAAGVFHVRLYHNLGGGTFGPRQELSVGLSSSSLVWGDFDGDGDKDLLATGNDNTNTRHVVVFRNNGGVFTSTVPVVPAGQGLDDNGGTDWGDYDNDGDLDVLVTGHDGTGVCHIRIYTNNGAGTFNPTPIELTVTGAVGGPGISRAQAAWGDYDKDAKIDIVVAGIDTTPIPTGTNRFIRVFHNDGGGVFTEKPAAIGGAVGIENRGVSWGDYNGDGWLDILENGYDGSANPRRLLVYTNNANGTFTGANVDTVSNGGGGLTWGESALADYNNNGTQDIVIQGWDGASRELRLYRNAGAFPWNNKQFVEAPGGALYQHGALSLADMDGDGDLDILTSGNDAAGQPQLRVYKNYSSLVSVNAAPNPPPDNPPPATFVFSAVGTSSATFKWTQATDNAPNPTPSVSLTYDVQVATNSLFIPPLVMPGGAFQPYPLAGGFYSTVLSSTFPWSSTGGLMDDTTYYFRVRTMDSGMAMSTWSVTGTLWTGVAPSTSTLSTGSGAPGQATMTWTSAGDDASKGNLNGFYRIQYSTTSSTAWSTAVTPAGAATITMTATNQAPGTAESTSTLSGLLEGTSYYFVMWTQDAAGLWSAISNQTTTYIQASPPGVSVITTTSTVPGQARISWNSAGDNGASGNLTGIYRIQYSTSPTVLWSTSTTPTGAFTLPVSTVSQVPGSAQSTTTANTLTEGTSYYFRLWTQDDSFLWSPISNQTTTFILAAAPSTSTILGASGGANQAQVSWLSAGDDGPSGALTGFYRIQYSTSPTILWSTSTTPTGAFTSTVPAVNQAAGSAQSTTTLANLLEGTSYYFRLWTQDESGFWSAISNQTTAYVLPVPPAASVITATATLADNPVINWTSAGDDGNAGNLTGSYRIQYSTNPSTVWSTAVTPAGAVTIPLAAVNQAPGSVQSTTTAATLMEGTSYYYVLWSQDDLGTWSAISNQATYYIQVPVRDVVVSAPQYVFGNVPVGLSTATTAAITVTYTGGRNTTFQLSASTVTPGGSPWSLFTSTGPDRAVVYAGFNAAQPLISAFGPEDVVLASPQACTATAYRLGQGCLNLAPGTAQPIWFRVDMPGSSSVANEQYIQVTITAGPP